MKKLMMICALLFSVITYASAQQGGGRGGMMMKPEDRVKQLDEKLKLNDEQKTKILDIYKSQNDEMAKAREAAGDDRSGMREKMTKVNDETNTKIEAVLTAEQKPAFKTILEERKKAMEARQNGGR